MAKKKMKKKVSKKTTKKKVQKKKAPKRRLKMPAASPDVPSVPTIEGPDGERLEIEEVPNPIPSKVAAPTVGKLELAMTVRDPKGNVVRTISYGLRLDEKTCTEEKVMTAAALSFRHFVLQNSFPWSKGKDSGRPGSIGMKFEELPEGEWPKDAATVTVSEPMAP